MALEDYWRRLDRGEIVDFENQEVPAEAIRKLLLGEAFYPQRVANQFRYHLKRARIRGIVDLRYARGPGGGPLSVLKLDDCQFEGPASDEVSTLDLRYAHIVSLQLQNCTVDSVNLSGSTVEGTVSLLGMAPQGGRCLIGLYAAKVGGDVGITGRLATDTPDAACINGDRLVCAGSVFLGPDLEIAGPTTFDRAQIGGAFEIGGGSISVTEGSALSMAHADVGSITFFRDADERSFRTKGQILLTHTKVRTDVTINGAILERLDASDYAFIGDQMHVGGSFVASAPSLKCDGIFSLTRVSVGDDLSLAGATIRTTSPSWSALDLSGSRIGGNVALQLAEIDGLRLDKAKVEASLLLTGAQIANHLQASGIHVAGAIEMDAGSNGDAVRSFVANGPVNLQSARIGGDLSCAGAHFAGADDYSLILREASVEGDVNLRPAYDGAGQTFDFRADHGVSLDFAKIRSLVVSGEIGASKGVSISAAYLHASKDVKLTSIGGTDHTFEATFNGTVSLRLASIEGQVRLQGAHIKLSEPGDALDLTNATVSELIIGRGLTGTTQRPFVTNGRLALSYLRVQRSVIIDTCEIDTGSAPSISAFGCRVGGNLSVLAPQDGDAPVKISGLVHFAETQVQGSAMIRGEFMGGLQFALSDCAGIFMIGGIFGSERPAGPEQPGITNSCVDLHNSRMKIGVEVLTETQFRGDVRFDSMVAGQTVELSSFTITPAAGADKAVISFANASLPNTLSFKQFESANVVTIDFSNASIGTLNDGAGKDWPTKTTLELGGLSYRILAETSEDHPDVLSPRLRWMKRSLPKARMLKENIFNPQPWKQLEHAFRSSGRDREADRVAMRRSFHSASNAPVWQRPFAHAFGLFFGFGYSSLRALLTVIALLLVGWAGVSVAANRPETFVLPPTFYDGSVLDLTTAASATVVQNRTDGTAQMAFPISDSASPSATAVSCGQAIEPFLYAADVFIPLVDLRQEERCDVTTASDAMLWRIAKAIYAVLGWIFVSLAILTLSGAVRRTSPI